MAVSFEKYTEAGPVGHTYLWSAEGGRWRVRFPQGGTVAFSRDSRTLAIGGVQDGKPRVWLVDAATGKQFRSFPVGGGGDGGVPPIAPGVCWSVGDTLLTCMRGGEGRIPYLPVRRWSREGRQLADYSPFHGVKLSADGRWAALQASKHEVRKLDRDIVRLVNLSTGNRAGEWPGLIANLGFGKDALFFHQQGSLVRVCPDTLEQARWKQPGGFTWWVLGDGVLATVEEPRDRRMSSDVSMVFRNFGVDDPLRVLSTEPGIASPEGRWFANDSGVWDLRTGRRVATFSQQPRIYRRWAFSADGQRLVCFEGGNESGSVFDLNNGTQQTLSSAYGKPADETGASTGATGGRGTCRAQPGRQTLAPNRWDLQIGGPAELQPFTLPGSGACR
ncbi:MAG: WD40 repeat domain-containing protein [Candidatus Eremiobacterota bacterium]